VIHVVLYFHSLRQLPSLLPSSNKLRVDDTKRHLLVTGLAYFFVLPINIVLIVVVFIVFISCDSFGCRDFVVQTVVVLEFTTAVGLILYVESHRGMDFSRTVLQLFFKEQQEPHGQEAEALSPEQGQEAEGKEAEEKVGFELTAAPALGV
jgi:hypothetical protein